MIDNRPLSPHLSIHKKVLTAVLSIFHRLSGIFLTIGSFFLVFWFLSVLIGENFYNYFQIVSSNFIFKVIYFFGHWHFFIICLMVFAIYSGLLVWEWI